MSENKTNTPKDINIKQITKENTKSRSQSEERSNAEIMSEMNKKMSKLIQGMSDMDRKITTIMEDNKKLRKELAEKNLAIDDLKKRMDHLEQRSRINNIEISGFPQTKNEDVREIVKAVCKTLKVDDITDRDIQAVHRVPRYNKAPNGNIVINFASRWTKNRVLMAAKEYRKSQKRNIVAKDFKQELGDTPIYLSEHLSPARKQLLRKTKHVAKDKNYKFVWTKEGQILVKKNEESKKTHTILNETDIASLL